MSDQGAVGKHDDDVIGCDYFLLVATHVQRTAHHYTDTEVKKAAAAVNAGTCLEDANLAANIFSHIGDAVKAVGSTFKIIFKVEKELQLAYIRTLTCKDVVNFFGLGGSNICPQIRVLQILKRRSV